jgi:hypothetical protein
MKPIHEVVDLGSVTIGTEVHVRYLKTVNLLERSVEIPPLSANKYRREEGNFPDVACSEITNKHRNRVSFCGGEARKYLHAPNMAPQSQLVKRSIR